MEFLLNAIFWIMGLFEVRSSDPVLAAFKHARRAMIVCTIAQFVFLSLAFAFAPGGANGAAQGSQLADQMRYLVSNGFALVAVGCMSGMVWFSVRCLHIYFKPERYSE
jgi:hypothetical protein